MVGFEGLAPHECFTKFFPADIYDLGARETNRYAKQMLDKIGELPERSRYRSWRDVHPDDIEAPFAIEIGMGWSVCDARTGYLLRFEVYTGRETEAIAEQGLGHRVAASLLRGFEWKGHVVFLDNFYSSVGLYESLRLQNVGACLISCVLHSLMVGSIKSGTKRCGIM